MGTSGVRGPGDEPLQVKEDLGLLGKALLAAVFLVGLKLIVHSYNLEFISTLPLLTALMGGVVFTLAILLAGVLSDFKESERIVGELASTLRRIHADLAIISVGDAWLAEMRGHVLALTRALNANFADGHRMRLRGVYGHLDALDRGLVYASSKGAPSSPLRTVQVNLGTVNRIVDRIEVVIETTFMRSGYVYAGTVVVTALAALMFTTIEPFIQGVLLYGFAGFLLVGLFLLVWDLDNPFAGHVRLSTRQMQKLETFLAGQVPAQAATGIVSAVPVPPPVVTPTVVTQ